jgi:hypothetical protein
MVSWDSDALRKTSHVSYINVGRHSFSDMNRLLTILLLTFSTIARGQDSVLVRETCKKITDLKNPDDIMEQIKIVSGQLMTYTPTIVNTPREKRVKATYTFQYRLHRELKKVCPHYLIDHSPKMYQRVIDLDDKFTRPQIDSIESVCVELSKSKNIYVYIVTIDNYFPDSTITDFSNRNREYWGQRGSYEKGNVMISFNTSKRQMRVSTSDVSMKYLSDEKCSEINKSMRPYFKNEDYFNGILKGLSILKESL